MGKCKSIIKNIKSEIYKRIRIIKSLLARRLFFVGEDVDTRASYLGRYPINIDDSCNMGRWKIASIESGYEGIAKRSILNGEECECFLYKDYNILIAIRADSREKAIEKIKSEHIRSNIYLLLFLSTILIVSALSQTPGFYIT